MLILKRFVGKAVFIGDDIQVRVLKINSDDSVDLGITAPNKVKILRSELYWRNKRKQKEQEQSQETQETAEPKNVLLAEEQQDVSTAE